MSFIKMVLDHNYLKHLLEKVILNFKLDNNKMQENIFLIYLIKYKNLKNKKIQVIPGKYSHLKWKTEFNVRNVKKLNTIFKKIIC